MASSEVGTMNLPEVWDRKGDAVVEFGRDLDLRLQIAGAVAKSGMTHHKTPEAVMTIALTAFEMGLPLMQALRGMYVVGGKIGIEGHLMDALAIQRCGVKKTKVQSDERVCELILHRPGWDALTVKYTIEDAARAGMVREANGKFVAAQGKDTWTKNPRAMLYWRALSEGLRQIAPDYFGGVYHLDELQEVTEIQRGASTVSTNQELDALREGVEPDPVEMDDSEIEQMAREIDDAVKAKVIDRERGRAALKLAETGRWAECRTEWDAVRSAVLDSMPAVQGSLLDRAS